MPVNRYILARFQAVGTGQSFAKVKEFGATVRVAFEGGGIVSYLSCMLQLCIAANFLSCVGKS